MNVLRLTLKKKWFDMIYSRMKNEEYREIKSYWIKRLLYDMRSEYPYDIETVCDALKSRYECPDLTYKFQQFDAIEFINGYNHSSPRFTIEFLGISIGQGNQSWGAEPSEIYFKIKLGKILKPINQ